MAGLTVPVICIVIGEGGSGGALGLGVGDYIHMLENSTYSVITPEGAAAILWKDAGKAKEAAEAMKITAADLKELGVIDEIIPEARGGAHRNILKQSENIDLMIRKTFEQLNGISKDELIEKRYEKIYEKLGKFRFQTLPFG